MIQGTVIQNHVTYSITLYVTQHGDHFYALACLARGEAEGPGRTLIVLAPALRGDLHTRSGGDKRRVGRCLGQILGDRLL